MSIPGYCKEALVRFGHVMRKKRHQPHTHTRPVYDVTIQYKKEQDTTPLLDKEGKTFVQQVTGTFLYYARAVDPTNLVALNVIATKQSAPSEKTMEKTLFLLDYVATSPDVVLPYNKNNIVLAVHRDASYLTEPKACSRAGGHFFLMKDEREPKKNGAVLNIVQIIKRVVTSAVETEIGALFINTRNAIPARYLLEEIGHSQPATPVQTDNSTALGFVTKNINRKQTKSAAMNYWYMRDQQDQKQFRYYWREGPSIMQIITPM